ncbi:MAG: hypothetical protein MPL62_12460, partial [Alphaproteobacteria bacterium]|nr:hypothetical protein [Alphaproteobacteria bacterium]
ALRAPSAPRPLNLRTFPRLENSDARPYITFEKSGGGGAPFLYLPLSAPLPPMFRAKQLVSPPGCFARNIDPPPPYQIKKRRFFNVSRETLRPAGERSLALVGVNPGLATTAAQASGTH